MIVLSFYMAYTNEASNYPDKTAEQIVYIPGYGVRVATSSLIGNILGKGNLARLRVTSRAAIFLTMAMMLVNGTLLYLFAHPFISLKNSVAAISPSTKPPPNTAISPMIKSRSISVYHF